MAYTRPLRSFACLILGFAAAASPTQAREVGALGRIVPMNGIVTLVGPGGNTIDRIFVRPGQIVKAGDPLVLFAGKPTLEIELAMAESHRADLDLTGSKAIQIRELSLSRLRASKSKDAAVQRLREASAKQAAKFANETLARLLKAKAATYSANLRSEREHQAEITRIGLATAKAESARARTKLDNDLKLAKLELERLKVKQASEIVAADQRIALAKEKLTKSTLRAPSGGTILETLRHEGESSGGALVKLADLTKMGIRTFVFQADVLRLKPKMRATVSNKSLPKPLMGTLASTGRLISDAGRVVPVMVLLDEPETASQLLNLEVDVRLSGGE